MLHHNPRGVTPDSIANEVARLAEEFKQVISGEEEGWDRFVETNLQSLIDFSQSNEAYFTDHADK